MNLRSFCPILSPELNSERQIKLMDLNAYKLLNQHAQLLKIKRSVFGLIGFLLTCTCVGINTPANARTSNYQDSCSDIYVYGNQLSAKCQKEDGHWRHTSIVLMGIENIDGTLQVTSYSNPSNYQDSCSNIFVRGNRLIATCRTVDGDWRKTSLVLHGIENINGDLEYTSNP